MAAINAVISLGIDSPASIKEFLTFGLQIGAPPSWVGSTYFGGTAYSDTGVMGVTFLSDATPVPAGSFVRHGFAHDADGRRYVALWPADDSVTYQAGIARRADGAMIIATSGTTVARIQGLALTFRGEVIAAVDTPVYRHNGWPCLADGTLCVSETA